MQDQANEIDFNQEKIEHAHICCCFQGSTKHKFLFMHQHLNDYLFINNFNI
jgi:hypothetical protein